MSEAVEGVIPSEVITRSVMISDGEMRLNGYWMFSVDCVDAAGQLDGARTAEPEGKRLDVILLFHGLMDSCEFELIRLQAEAYARAGFAVLAVDFNGHGKSYGTMEEMTITREIADAEAAFQYARTQTFTAHIYAIGHSQGAVVATALAASHPDEIDALVLLAPGGMIADRIRAGRLAGTKFDPADPPAKIPVFDDFVGRSYLLDAASLDLYRYCEEYKKPVCLVWGSLDNMVPYDVIERYEICYQNGGCEVQVEVIPSAGHEFWEQEDEVSTAVLEFLK